jgi:hypothetical protein
MNLREIEERVAAMGAAEEPEFLFELLRAYGIPKATLATKKLDEAQAGLLQFGLLQLTVGLTSYILVLPNIFLPK